MTATTAPALLLLLLAATVVQKTQAKLRQNCNIRPGIMPSSCPNYSSGVFDMHAAPTCCTDPLAQPDWIYTSEHVCQWATPILLAMPNITVAGQRTQVLLPISEGRMGANLSVSNGCSTGSARSIWQRPSPLNGMNWEHHSIVVNASTPQGGIVLGSAVWDPARHRAHLFYTTADAVKPRALHVRSEVLEPWPGNDANVQMPVWGAPTDITASLAAQGLHMHRFGPSTGVATGTGELLVCGVSVNGSMVCVAATPSTSGTTLTVRAAGQLSHPGGVHAVSMTAFSNGSLAFSLRVTSGLLFARSDDSGASIITTSQTNIVLPPSSCNGALAVLPSGGLVLASSSGQRMIIRLHNSSAAGGWTVIPANLWPTGLAGCSGLASLGDGRLALLFEQRSQDWRGTSASAPERILISMVPSSPQSPLPPPPPNPPPSNPPATKVLPTPVAREILVTAPHTLPSTLPVLDRADLTGQTDAYKPWLTIIPQTGELIMTYAADRKTLLVIRRSSQQGAPGSWGVEEPHPEVRGDNEYSIHALHDGTVVLVDGCAFSCP